MRWRLLLVGIAVACGGSSTGDDGGLFDSGGMDSTLDVAQQNDGGGNDVTTQNDSGGNDTGTSDAADGGNPTDSGATIGIWQCGTAMVTDCSMCTGFTQPCAYCNTMDASDLRGACVQTGTNCFNAAPMGFQDCTCMDAAACPESFQVCTMFGRCHTCSDSTMNAGLTCENGNKCAPADGGCM